MRLDHLLSKEHTPRSSANVTRRMVVFTSGIVDVRCAVLAPASSVLLHHLVLPGGGAWNLGVRGWGRVVGTLLGV